jgi:hypothetical protein
MEKSLELMEKLHETMRKAAPVGDQPFSRHTLRTMFNFSAYGWHLLQDMAERIKQLEEQVSLMHRHAIWPDAEEGPRPEEAK